MLVVMEWAFTRMTIMKLNARSFGQTELPEGLLIHSPAGEATEDVVEEVKQLGEVQYIIAPNHLHHLFLTTWVKAFQSCQLWGAPGLLEKRPDLPWRGILHNNGVNGLQPMWEWQPDVQHVYIDGNSALNEIALYHHASQTLILTDLIQEHDAENLGWTMATIIKVIGLNHTAGVPPDIKLMYRNKPLARKAITQILEFPFDRLIVSHGRIYEHCREMFTQNFSFLLDDKQN